MTGRYKGRYQQDFSALIDKVLDSAVNHSELKVHYTLKHVKVGGHCRLLTLKFIILQNYFEFQRILTTRQSCYFHHKLFITCSTKQIASKEKPKVGMARD